MSDAQVLNDYNTFKNIGGFTLDLNESLFFLSCFVCQIWFLQLRF
jgi:hypothetical protein